MNETISANTGELQVGEADSTQNATATNIVLAGYDIEKINTNFANELSSSTFLQNGARNTDVEPAPSSSLCKMKILPQVTF